MSKRIYAKDIETQKACLLIIEQRFDEMGLGINPSKKSFIHFNPAFNKANEIKKFIESKNWIFSSFDIRTEICELVSED